MVTSSNLGPLGITSGATPPNAGLGVGTQPLSTTGPGGLVGSVVEAATVAAPAIDAEIEGLNLSATARAGAYALKASHPKVSFTSGRRAKDDQARAMAGNVVSNRKWIEATYAKSDLRTALQAWVNEHSEAKTKAEIQAGLLAIFDAQDDATLGKFSKHLSGDAFDVQPVSTKDADDIKKTIRGLPGLGLFLDMEGGLVRWHAQF
jgi:hypothetical protein